MKTLILLAIGTGLRKDNLLSLEWDDVEWRAGAEGVRVLRTKNGSKKFAPVRGSALSALKHWANHCLRSNPLLRGKIFPSENDRNKSFNIETEWRNLLRRAGIADFRFHDLRHTGASYLAMSGATVPELLDFLGSKTPSMAMRYTHLMKSHSATVVEQMMSNFVK